jgi:hypothetical protein
VIVHDSCELQGAVRAETRDAYSRSAERASGTGGPVIHLLAGIWACVSAWRDQGVARVPVEGAVVAKLVARWQPLLTRMLVLTLVPKS